ncbi:MAG: FtsX-like permease family protein [Candidatus Bathyarchaeia archaeon]
MSLRNIRRRKIRTTLCIIGVALSTMMLIGIGTALTRCTNLVEDMNLLFKDKIIVVDRGVFVVQTVPVGGTIPEVTLQEIEKIHGVKRATPLCCWLNFETNESVLLPSSVIFGVPLDSTYVLTGSIPLKAGNWPQNDTAEEVVVGLSLAEQYGLNVGSRINVKDYTVEVVGILDSKLSIFSRAIIMPLKLAQKIYRFYGLVNMIVVEPNDGTSSNELSKAIEKEIVGIKALTEKERNSLIQPLLEEIERWNFGITAALLFLTMCLVATITFMNISERRREFAILDAIGAPKTTTLRMVAVEALTVGLIGSVIGLILGAIAAVVIASKYTSIPMQLFMSSLTDLLPLSLVVETICSTAAVSCLGGIISLLVTNREITTEILRGEH